MSAELIGILAVGVTLLIGLGGLILTLGNWLRGDIHRLGDRVTLLESDVAGLQREFSELRGELCARFDLEPAAGD